MAHAPVSQKGCFTATYPSTQWQEVPCTTAPALPFPPARGPRPSTIGNGTDVSASVSGHISEAIGSFDSITGVTSETATDPYTGKTGSNVYTLQLNSNTFTTSVCKGSSCVGWEQFVYESDSNSSMFIQYWLINYSGTCPAGWNSYSGDCYKNSSAVTVPQTAVTNFATVSLTGQATSGGNDTFIVQIGSTLYSLQNQDSVVNLAQGWQQAEFNIFGDCCSTQANFNSGAALVVRTAVDYGSLSAPSCYSGGFTGETNNLSFASAPTASPGTYPAVVFRESTAGGAASACASATEVGGTGGSSGQHLTDTHDFNGDGKSDIAWRDTAGNVAIWLMNGTQILSGPILANVPTNWTIVGQRQLNNSGDADLVWRDTAGDLAIWMMNGTQIVSGPILGNVPSSWNIVGTGPYNASNGYAELFWRNSNGELGIWFMNGTQILSSSDLGNVPTNWAIIATNDFNGDGKTDILWRDTAGDVAFWFMNGTQIVTNVGIGNVPNNWVIVGTGDFNGDGYADILWRDTAGDVAIWLMNGSQIISNVGLGNVSLSWSIVETGDFNGDSKSDILWRNANGDVGVWFMNGTQIVSGPDFINVPTNWTIQGANAD